jgi:hypothetical protein
VLSSWKEGRGLLNNTPFFHLTLILAMTAASVAAASVAAARVAAVCVTAASTHLVSMEVIEGSVSTSRKWTMVAMMWIEAVINVAVKACGAVKPGTGSDEDTAAKPCGAVVPVWSAAVRGIVEVAVRANRRCSNVDGDLGGCRARDAQ